MTTAPRRLSFFEDRPRLPTITSFARAITAAALSELKKQSAEKVLAATWGDDEIATLIVRAAVTPTTTASAAALSPYRVGPLLAGLAPDSAAVRLFSRAVKIDLSGVSTVRIPRPTSLIDTPPIFIGESQPFPLVDSALTNATVGPTSKIALGAAVTEELEFASPENASLIVGRILAMQSARGLDLVVFGAGASTANQPAGLLNGVSAIGAGASMASDIANLIGAIASAGLNTESAIFVAHPRQAAVLKLSAGPQFNYPIFGASVLAAGTVVAIVPDAIASGYEGLPRIDTSKAALGHSANPASEIVTAGGAVASPTQSGFQQSLVLVRLRLDATWAVLQPGAVQVINSVTW